MTVLAGCPGGQAAPPDGGVVAACETPIPVQSLAGMPCRFPIPAPPCDVVDRESIAVIVNGTEIARDLVNGWNYTDGTMQTIDVHGPDCDAITAGASMAITVMFIVDGIP